MVWDFKNTQKCLLMLVLDIFTKMYYFIDEFINITELFIFTEGVLQKIQKTTFFVDFLPNFYFIEEIINISEFSNITYFLNKFFS